MTATQNYNHVNNMCIYVYVEPEHFIDLMLKIASNSISDLDFLKIFWGAGWCSATYLMATQSSLWVAIVATHM